MPKQMTIEESRALFFRYTTGQDHPSRPVVFLICDSDWRSRTELRDVLVADVVSDHVADMSTLQVDLETDLVLLFKATAGEHPDQLLEQLEKQLLERFRNAVEKQWNYHLPVLNDLRALAQVLGEVRKKVVVIINNYNEAKIDHLLRPFIRDSLLLHISWVLVSERDLVKTNRRSGLTFVGYEEEHRIDVITLRKRITKQPRLPEILLGGQGETLEPFPTATVSTSRKSTHPFFALTDDSALEKILDFIKHEGLPFKGLPIEDIVNSIKGRQGQSAFRKKLLALFQQCVVSRVTSYNVLEAAHIDPFCVTQNNDIWNGLVLRADMHTLFDLYTMALKPESNGVKVLFHSQVRAHKDYRKYHNVVIQLPSLQSHAQDEGKRRCALDRHWTRCISLYNRNAFLVASE